MTEYFINPVPKPRMTRSDKWKKRRCVSAYWGFKDRVKDLKITLPVPYKVTFFIPMPQTWSQKKRSQMNGQPHLSRPDRDNLEKALLDALFTDDSHMWSGWTEKRWRDRAGIKVEAI